MWTITLIIIVGLGIAIICHLMEKFKRHQIFCQREILSNDSIYDKFYSNSGLKKEIVAEVWNEISAIFKIESGKMRPTDRFGHEIGRSFWITNEPLDTLSELAIRRSKRHKASINLKDIKNIDDYIRKFASLENHK